MKRLTKTSRNASSKARRLKRFALGLGVDVFGIGDLNHFRPYVGLDLPLLNFPNAISIGMRLSNSIVNRITIEDPTPEYAHHYKAVNAFLDDVALRIANRIQAGGYAAMPIPASQITRPDLHQGVVSHKAIAALAGLGWIGKSQLLVNPRLGPRLRFASILTTMPLKAGKPLKNQCGACDVCVRACPTHAIKTTAHHEQRWVREEVFDPESCYQRLIKFRDDPRYGVSICGVCVKLCPVGARKR